MVFKVEAHCWSRQPKRCLQVKQSVPPCVVYGRALFHIHTLNSGKILNSWCQNHSFLLLLDPWWFSNCIFHALVPLADLGILNHILSWSQVPNRSQNTKDSKVCQVRLGTTCKNVYQRQTTTQLLLVQEYPTCLYYFCHCVFYLFFCQQRINKIPRKSLPSRASTHVLAASYNEARSSVILYFFFSFFDTMYMAAAPAYFTANLSVKLKLPASQRFEG